MSMRNENIKTASNSIEFLNNQMQTTNLKELKDGLSQLNTISDAKFNA